MLNQKKIYNCARKPLHNDTNFKSGNRQPPISTIMDNLVNLPQISDDWVGLKNVSTHPHQKQLISKSMRHFENLQDMQGHKFTKVVRPHRAWKYVTESNWYIPEPSECCSYSVCYSQWIHPIRNQCPHQKSAFVSKANQLLDILILFKCIKAYMHALVAHLPQFITLYCSIIPFTQQGLEHLNDHYTH